MCAERTHAVSVQTTSIPTLGERPPSGYLKKCRLLSKLQNGSKAACTFTPSPVGEGRGEGKTTAPISDGPQTQGRLKSPANPNLTGGNRLKECNGIEYTYDALGNLIYRQLPNGENQYYQYDLENQLVRAEIKKPAGNTEIWTYAYDPFGRRLSKERQDKLAWTSTEPKRTHFVWDGSRLLQEYTYKGSYTYIYTDQDSYEPLDQVFHNNQDEAHYLSYFHNDQIDIPREMTDIHGNLVWLELHFDPDLLNRITRVMGAMSEGVRKELERWEFCVE